MDNRAWRWLYRELPELVSQGIVPAEVAERMREHYGEPDAPGGTARRWAIVLFSILGAVLIGGGIILLLAHNWEELSRPMRAVIAVLPLVMVTGLGVWRLGVGDPSTAWREGVGAGQTLAVGISIALVAQTYNLGGRFDEFMLTWSLLVLPVAYLLRAVLPALLYLVGITVWTGSVSAQGGSGWGYFPLLAAALPFLWWTARENRYHPRPVLFAWMLAVTVGIGTGLASERVSERLAWWPVLFGGLFALLYLVGARWWGGAAAVWQRPFQSVGALGAVGLAAILSFSDPWLDPGALGGWQAYRQEVGGWQAGSQLVVAVLFPLSALVLWAGSWKRRAWLEVMMGSLPVMALAGWAAARQDAAGFSAILFNLHLLGLGIGTLVLGLQGRRLGTVNAGLAVIALVLLCRFFDSDLGFVERGVAFILIGIGFLVTNGVLLRWKGATAS